MSTASSSGADRDRSPIDQRWIQDYVDTLMRCADSLPEEGAMRKSALARAEHCMDMLEAWQLRNAPRER